MAPGTTNRMLRNVPHAVTDFLRREASGRRISVNERILQILSAHVSGQDAAGPPLMSLDVARQYQVLGPRGGDAIALLGEAKARQEWVEAWRATGTWPPGAVAALERHVAEREREHTQELQTSARRPGDYALAGAGEAEGPGEAS